MQIGIVGKPSSGKSTFFSSSTLVDVGMASYPFTTIEPNKGTGFVRVEDAGKYFDVESNPKNGFLVKTNEGPIRYVPVELIDVAGLVPGASEGKGLGNKFLNDLSQADALVHVVDASGTTNEEGNATTGHDPCKDIDFLENEIELWFLKIIEKNWDKISKIPKKELKEKVELLSNCLSGVKILKSHIESALKEMGIEEKMLKEWSEEDKREFASIARKLSKPIIIAANKCDLEGAKENIDKMKNNYPHLKIVPCSAASELSLRKAAKAEIIDYYPGASIFEVKGEINEKQKEGLEIIRKNVLEEFGETGVQKVLDTAVLDLLGYIPIFPGGTKSLVDKEGRTLADCFLMKNGSKVIDFAYTLHTTMGDNFIRATDVKTKLVIGRDHELKYGDVIEISFNKR
jgi:ribosome-binding ATPase YchF (GTP1/OBG family)